MLDRLEWMYESHGSFRWDTSVRMYWYFNVGLLLFIIFRLITYVLITLHYINIKIWDRRVSMWEIRDKESNPYSSLKILISQFQCSSYSDKCLTSQVGKVFMFVSHTKNPNKQWPYFDYGNHHTLFRIFAIVDVENHAQLRRW